METPTPATGSPRLLTQLREQIRLKNYSLRTEQSYMAWAWRLILFHGKRHPAEMGTPEVEAFLIWLAVKRQVPASTQNQAKAALLFLYQEVLQCNLPWLSEVVTAKTLRRCPVVLAANKAAGMAMSSCTGRHMTSVTGGALFPPRL